MFKEIFEIQPQTDLRKFENFLEETYTLSNRINAFSNNKLYTLEIEVSRYCNYSCIYCYNKSEQKGIVQDKAIIELILQQAQDYGIKEIYWLGGETLLYSGIWDLLILSKQLGFRNVVATNGSPIRQNNVDLIKNNVDCIYFHLDSLDSNVFSKLQNISLSESSQRIKKSKTGIDLLINSGFDSKNIRLSCVLTKLSLSSLCDLLKWAIIENGFHTSTLIPMARLGRAKAFYNDQHLNIYELESAYKLRANIEKRPFLLNLGPSEFCKHYELTNCYIDVFGFVRPYVGINSQYGNINYKSLNEILNKNLEALNFGDSVNIDGSKNITGTTCDICSNGKYCFGTRTFTYLLNKSNENEHTCWHRNF